MKKLTTLLCLLQIITITGFARDSWQRISPLPQEQTLNCVANIPGTDRVIAVGDGATVMISEDVGETWEIIHQPGNVPFDMDFIGVEFLDENNGFLYGDYQSLLITANGGYSWEVIYQGDTTNDKRILDIEFLDNQRGFMIDDSRQLFKTYDGGISWSPVDDVTSTLLTKVAFGSDLTGIIITSDSAIYRTVDGGENWIYDSNPQGLNTMILNDVSFLTNSTILLSGYTPGESGTKICKSNDSGETWEQMYVSWESSDKDCFVFFNDTCGVLIIPPFSWCCSDVRVIRTLDGGETWAKLPPISYPFNQRFVYSVCNVGDSSLVAVGHNGAVHSSYDMGYSWYPYFQQTFFGELSDFWTINDMLYCSLFKYQGQFGEVAAFYHSTDSAQNWIQRGSLPYESLCVYFASSDTGYAAYIFNDLEISKTVDGGYNWNAISTFTPYWPQDIEFFDTENAVIVCQIYIIKSVDGGETWFDVTPDPAPPVYFHNVKYGTRDIVIAVGESVNVNFSAVWRSNDGGESWIPVDDLPGMIYNIVYTLSQSTYFIGGFNEILKSENAGESWHVTEIHTLEEIEVFDISFPIDDIGYAVGKGEVRCLKTIDGGENWHPIEIDITSGLKTVHFFDENNGIVMGENGLILRTDNGGTTFIEEKPAIPQQPSAITLFPNPATEILNITFEDPQQRGELIFYTTNGTEVMRRTHNPNVTGIIMNVQTMDAGAYVVQYVVDGKIIETTKLVIQ